MCLRIQSLMSLIMLSSYLSKGTLLHFLRFILRLAIFLMTSKRFSKKNKDLICLITPLTSSAQASIISVRLGSIGVAISPAALAKLPAVMKKCSRHEALCAVTLLCNALNTSSRMHESLQYSCIFGCADSNDTTNHYFSCPILNSISPFDKVVPLCLDSWICFSNNRLLGIFYELYNYVKYNQEFSFSLSLYLALFKVNSLADPNTGIALS